MRILIACHCKKPIYRANSGRFLSPKLELISNTHSINTSETEIHYIDYADICDKSDEAPIQYKDWASIPDNYFDFVWLQYCPIWGKINDNIKMIFNSAYKVLKTTGKVIFGLSRAYESEEKVFKSILYISAILNKLDNTNIYDLKLVNTEDLPFYLISNDTPDIFDKYIVLDKVLSGGRRKTQTKRKKNKRTRKVKR